MLVIFSNYFKAGWWDPGRKWSICIGVAPNATSTSIYELHLQERNTAGVEEGTEKPMINDKSNNATNDYATQGEEKYMYA